MAIASPTEQKVGLYLDDVLVHAPFHTVQGISDGGSVSIFNTDMLETLYERWKFTLYGELINATNHRNSRVNSFDGVNTRTGQAFLSVMRVFPILPSAGLMLEF